MIDEIETQDEIVDLVAGCAIVAAPEIRALRIVRTSRPMEQELDLLRTALRQARAQRLEARLEAVRARDLASCARDGVAELRKEIERLRNELREANAEVERRKIPAYWMEMAAGTMDRWADFHPLEFSVGCRQMNNYAQFDGEEVWAGDGIQYRFEVHHLPSGLKANFKIANTDTRALRAESAVRTVMEMMKLKGEVKRRQRHEDTKTP